MRWWGGEEEEKGEKARMSRSDKMRRGMIMSTMGGGGNGGTTSGKTTSATVSVPNITIPFTPYIYINVTSFFLLLLPLSFHILNSFHRNKKIQLPQQA